jgi:hypothetical protein
MLEARSGTKFLTNSANPTLWTLFGSHKELGGASVWLPTTKSQKSTWFRCVQVKCDMPLESSRWELQLGLDLVPIQAWGEKLWMPKVPRVQTETVSGFLLGSLGKKHHSDVASARSCKEYYKGEGGGFPQVRAVMSQVSPSCPWLVPTPKGCRMNSNQLVIGFGCRTN